MPAQPGVRGVRGVVVEVHPLARQGTVQTRFKFYEVEAPAPHEIAGLLSRRVPNRRDVVNIATFASGNVRAALLDAERLMQAAA